MHARSIVDDSSIVTEVLVPPAVPHPQIQTGYRLEVVTARKLEFETDAFAFSDQVRCRLWREGERERDRGSMSCMMAGSLEHFDLISRVGLGSLADCKEFRTYMLMVLGTHQIAVKRT